MTTHPSSLAWRIHGQGSLAGYCSWGCKESDMTEAIQHTRTHKQPATSSPPLDGCHLEPLMALPQSSSHPAPLQLGDLTFSVFS